VNHFDLFIHENHKHRINNVLNYWAEQTSFPLKEFNHIYYKKNKISTNRKNIGNSYFGVLKLRVRASSSLLRKIAGWIHGVNKYYWGVV